MTLRATIFMVCKVTVFFFMNGVVLQLETSDPKPDTTWLSVFQRQKYSTINKSIQYSVYRK